MFIYNLEDIAKKLKIDFDGITKQEEVMKTGLTAAEVAKTVKYVFDLPQENTTC